MKLKLDLKNRVPEPEEVMENKEALEYKKAHRFDPAKKGSAYSITAIDIFKRIKITKGNVLDIACGYGALVCQMNYFKPDLEFTGIDNSKSMIDLGQENYSNFKFIKMNANKLNFPDETFDLIICKDSFHHFTNSIEVLKEIYRVLKKKGFIYLTDLRRDSPKKVIQEVYNELIFINETNARQYIDSIKASYKISEIKKLFKKANIENYNIWNAKVNKNFIKEYEINHHDNLSAKNFIKDRWIAIIKK